MSSVLHSVRRDQIDDSTLQAVPLPLLSLSPSGSGVHVGMVLGEDCAHFPCSVWGSSLWVAMFQGLVLRNVGCLDELLLITVTKVCSSCGKLSECFVPGHRLNITAENDCRRLHCSLRDLSSLLQAVGRLAEYFIGDVFAARFSDALTVVER